MTEQELEGYVRPALPPEGEANFTDEHPWDVRRSPLPEGVLVEQARIPMRDGVELAATVFRPRDGEPTPVITTMTPYVKDRYDQWEYFRDPPKGSVAGFYMGTVEISDHTPFEAPDPGFWVPRGYSVVLIDSPGRGKSGSNPADPPSPTERWADAMNWMADQPWADGKIGMSGVSALCMTQWIAAKEAPPQLKAMIPWEGFNATGPGNGFGGVPELGFAKWLVWQWLEPSLNPDAEGPEPEFFEWEYDLSAISVPALVCASFSDQELHTWDTFRAYEEMSSVDKWLFGHRRQKWGAYYGTPELELQEQFFRRFLKGDASAMDGVPPVRLEVNVSRDRFKVIEADSWPIPGVSHQRLYLDAARSGLDLKAPETEAAIDISPVPVGDDENRAVFDFTFEQETDLIGYMALNLAVAVEGAPDSDLFVGVEKLDRDGNEVYFYSVSGGFANGPVTRGWLRLSKRKLDTGRSTDAQPVLAYDEDLPVLDGEVIDVVVPLMPSGTTFLAGETLRLVVQAWSAPGQWDGAGAREWLTIEGGTTRIHTGRSRDSYLLIPVAS